VLLKSKLFLYSFNRIQPNLYITFFEHLRYYNENPSKNNEILSAPGWLHKARRIDISKREALKNPHEKEMINKQNIKHFISVKYADYLSIVSNDRYYDLALF
jgi:hypothetical protein